MKRLLIDPDFEAWRITAREQLHAGYHPDQLDLQDATAPTSLTLALEADEPPTGPPLPRPTISKSFLEAAGYVAVHRDPQRWNLLYRILFRLQSNRNLLALETDDDIIQLTRLESQVKRDLHKMHAFVRFRKVLEPSDPSERPTVLDEPIPIDPDPHAHHLVLETPTPFGPIKTELESCPPEDITPDADCEHFIAWYQPDHRILPLAAPFFAERFAIMHWTILTPDASAVWDPITKQLTFAPGVPRESAPAEDELEGLWRSYYASIFNPARLNPAAMKSEMPVRYWKNLPELTLLPTLITQSKTRVQNMVQRQQSQPTAQPFVPDHHTIRAIAEALPTCKGCELYCHATQVVPGRGPATAALMLVGEQPGDQEDLQGEPFIGPAGAVLDHILEDLRIPRKEVYVTNAVKHFKFVQRGKLRLHQSPRMSEIMACRPWLLAEIDAIKPKVVLCLGASASKSLLGGTFALMKDHGKLNSTPFADKVFATIHPSAVLRARDEPNRQQLQQFLTDDLAKAWQATIST
ncbi:UdgX family uracil-DNA binding protein [Granulicella tundricola]|uniref:Type-4 uracil-DNA glycosylase n=1 Tax=Granulicella tundricola (strain ATCC BAA-1859 / DSM 23138 / MP5ACTX9) TaxID=1198114 RepID=E8WZH3_GRATM|nr:UdgX family uracil-DNA binding protein [Granulicella tundricola]ADW68861.1 phage SPO1 DNA polymerase-related protein [Granulicella tundricola MP5ACTX9]